MSSLLQLADAELAVAAYINARAVNIGLCDKYIMIYPYITVHQHVVNNMVYVNDIMI
jgi:hypothetical protein